MALILCPECNKSISDRATTCPNCGYPISATTAYNVSLIAIPQQGKMSILSELKSFLRLGLSESLTLVNNLPSVLFENVSIENANELKAHFEELGATVNVELSETHDIAKPLNRYDLNEVHCPRCGSTAITTGQRGFSIVTGFLGSNKTVNRCAKCGYSWKP